MGMDMMVPTTAEAVAEAIGMPEIQAVQGAVRFGGRQLHCSCHGLRDGNVHAGVLCPRYLGVYDA